MNNLYIIASGFIAYALIWAIIPRKRAEIVEAERQRPPERDRPLDGYNEVSNALLKMRNDFDNLKREGKL